MIKHEIYGTGTKVAGGALTYAGSYVVAEKTASAAQIAAAADIANLVAVICTALFFLAQFLLVIVKIYKEIKTIGVDNGKDS